MEDLLNTTLTAGGGGILAVIAYLKIIARRFDKVDKIMDRIVQKFDKLDDKVRDHEVRIQVLEKLEQRERGES